MACLNFDMTYIEIKLITPFVTQQTKGTHTGRCMTKGVVSLISMSTSTMVLQLLIIPPCSPRGRPFVLRISIGADSILK